MEDKKKVEDQKKTKASGNLKPSTDKNKVDPSKKPDFKNKH